MWLLHSQKLKSNGDKSCRINVIIIFAEKGIGTSKAVGNNLFYSSAWPERLTSPLFYSYD